MSRPFPDTFEDERSPLSPLSGGPSQSISYQANVNRRKTKKWADAKPVSYGGDDWGDEYDDEYDAAPPQPEVPKPTGFRQPGQGVGGIQQPAGNYNDGRKPYGDLQGPPMVADRSATQPQQFRRNSFGDDDERRAFSSGPIQFLHQGREAPQLQVQTQRQQQNMGGLPDPGPRPMETPPIQAPGGFPETPYSLTESHRGYVDQPYHQQYQQPYQPASPVNVRGTPIEPGYGTNTSPMSAGRPPRKSSLSQSSIPDSSSYQSHSGEKSQEPKMKPWPGPDVLSSSENSAPPTAKALPFVRPADIYRRLEEERTKERQSTESGRPSMDSIMRDREMSPTAAQPSVISPPQDQYTHARSGSQSEYTDSGRRLGQSLEPVAERKSEYSFMDASTRSPEVAQKLKEIKQADSESPYQPYRKQSPEDTPGISFNNNSQISEQDSSFEAEKRRRFSTSPKLPDLNRMSGFGFDMWGAPPAEPEPEPARPVVAVAQPLVKAQEPPVLKKEPSLGFNSVVHQAFDRNDSFSDARDPSRTGSEDSVGTTGVSPIISKDAFLADASTPMITEEKEPDSRAGSGHATPKQQNPPSTPSVQFGHRRDLSAPISVKSRDASPARQPAVVTPSIIGPGVQVHVSEDSEMSSESPEEQQVQDQARYERYPRPPIPGGWTSYATTGGENVQELEEPNEGAPSDTSKIAPFTADIIASNPLPDELSPTIAARMEEIKPPSPELVPIIQAKAADDRSPIIASEMANLRIPSPSPEHAPTTTGSDEFSPSLAKETEIVALPTPDPHMGPIGNPYSTAPVDPRIDGGHNQSQTETPVSKESADTVTGLAPPAIHEPGVSPGSSVGPTPPPKDTPRMPDPGDADYFPPPVPLKRRTAEEVAAAEGLAPPQRPAMIPTLSTNTSAYDDENDKLRKEIVKSLSPRQSLSGPSSGPAQPSNLGQSMLAVSSYDAPRESMYLPSEYDSYWGATNDEPSTYTVQSQQQEVAQSPITPQNDVKFNITAASPSSEDATTPPIPPLNPKRISRTSMGSIPGITNDGRRYSFDQGNERVSREQSSQSTPALAPVDASPPVQEPNSKPWSPENGSAKGKLPVDLQRADSASPAPLSIRSARTDKTSDMSSQKPKEEATGQTEGILGTMAAVGAVIAATVLPIGGPSANPDDYAPEVVGKDVLELDGVVVDEDDHINDKSLSAEVSPISAASQQDIPPMMNVVPPPSPTHGQQPSMSQPGMTPSPLNISRPTTATSHNQTSRPPQNQAPPMEFRQIMVMPSSEQRIEAYNKTRLQYAHMESGLTDWLAVTTNTSLTPLHGQDATSSKAGSVAQGGLAPYYQQYINASSAATPVGGNISSPQRQSTLGAIGLGTQSSFSSGGRSQQQAQQAAQQAKEKGKELLHSAGIFGGAVGKKGKGLFKKGTSRWLGGGDKESDDTRDTPPPAPSKPEGYTPSVRSASFSTYTTPRPSMSMGGPGLQRQTSGEYPVFAPQARDESPSPRGPMPSMTPAESPKTTPSKRRTSWLKNLGSHHKNASGRPSSRGKQDSYDAKTPPRRAFSHDVGSLLHLRRPSMDQQQRQQQQFRPPFGQHSGYIHASPQNSIGSQYASPQNSFGPSNHRPLYGSTAGSYGRQRSGSLPLPPGVTVDAREVSSVASNTPPSLAQPMAPQIQLEPPPPTLMKDEYWLSISPTNSGSAQLSVISSQRDSGSPHPSQNTSRHPSGVPSVAQSLTSEQRLENEETRDNFDVDKPLPSLETVQDDHEHTGVKPPVPIGKYQPSWDPFNATPIAEEREGSEYSFGAGKISPPKLSPPNLDTVNEGEGNIDSDQSRNPVSADEAGIVLAAEATTAAPALAYNTRKMKEHEEEQHQPQIRETIVETRELDEDDIYDASPPSKCARRSLSVQRDQSKSTPQVSFGLAAGMVTTLGAIKDQVQALRSDDNTPQWTQDKEWQLVEHNDALLATAPKNDPSYFPPTAPSEKSGYASTPPFNARLGNNDRSKNQARVHSRDISEASVGSGMSIATMTSGEIADASQITVEQTSPSSVDLRDSLQSIGSKQNQEQEQDLDQRALPKPAFMEARWGEEGQRTPTIESVPGWFSETPDEGEASSFVRAASAKEDDLTPCQEQPIISSLLPAQQLLSGHIEQQQGFDKATHGFQSSLEEATTCRKFPIEGNGQPLSKAEMIPEAVQRAQDNVSDISDVDDESPYHETLGIIRALGVEAQRTEREVELQSGIVQSRGLMTAQREHDTKAKLEQALSGTAMRLGQPQPRHGQSEAEAARASNAASGQLAQLAHAGKREFSPDDDEDYDQELYLSNWERAELNQRRKSWKASHPGEMVPYYVLHPRYTKGIVVSEEPQTRQREPGAERLRAANADVIGQLGKGHHAGKYTFSSETGDDEKPSPPDLRQLKAQKLKAFEEDDQKIKDELARQKALLSQVYNKGSTISGEPVSRQRDEAEKMRASNAQTAQKISKDGPTVKEELQRRKAEGGWLQQGITESREPQSVQRAFSERMMVESEQVPRHGGMDLAISAQQISEAEESGKYSRPVALNHDLTNVGPNEIKDATLSREPADVRLVMGEGEKMRIVSAQVVEQEHGRAQVPYFAAMATIPRSNHQAQMRLPDATITKPQCRQMGLEGVNQLICEGSVKSMQPEVYKRGTEAEIGPATNAKVVRNLYDGDTVEEELLWRKRGRLAQHGVAISREPEVRQADFQESQSMCLHNEQNMHRTRIEEGAERMRKSNSRKLWTQQDQVDFDNVHGAQNTHEHATFEPWSVSTSGEPDSRQRESSPRRDSVELARARSLSRARRAAHGDDEDEDHSRPHVVHFVTEEEEEVKKAASGAWLSDMKVEEDKMRQQEAERAAAIARNSQVGKSDRVKLGIAESREAAGKQREPDAKRKSWAQEMFSHIPLVGDKAGAFAVSKTTNIDHQTPKDIQLQDQQGGPAPMQHQPQPQPNTGIQVPLGLQQMARNKSSMRKGLEAVRRDLDDSPPPRSPARASRVLVPFEMTKPMAETDESQLAPAEFRCGNFPSSGPEHDDGMAKSRGDFMHDPPNCSSRQQHRSPLSPSELRMPVDTVQSRSIVPVEVQNVAQHHTRTTLASPLPSLSVSKHRSSPSKNLISEEQRNPESPSTASASGSGFAIPPIRRTSTFGFGVVTKAKPAKDRFSIEDDEGDDAAGNQSSHIVSPISTASINDDSLLLPAAPKLRREEAVANSPDLRQRAESVGIAPSGSTQSEVSPNVPEQKQDTFVTVSSSLGRNSSVPRKASQEVRDTRANRFSFQREGSEPAQEVLSRPPITHQSSSDYNQPWTGQSTPNPLKSERPNFMVEPQPCVRPIVTNIAPVGAPMVHGQDQQQLHPHENMLQARCGPVPAQPHKTHPETQQQQQPVPPHQTASQFSGQTRRQSCAPHEPQRFSITAQHQNNLAIDPQRMMQQLGPPFNEVGTMPSQPPKIMPQYNETVARPLSYTRSGARDGPIGIPPSSAERYPELFQNAQPAAPPTSPARDGDGRRDKEREDDIPGDYAVVRKGHLPRQQATEYALPGVGPPADYPRDSNGGGRSSRRNSGFLKEIGGRLSRDSSRHRERRSSVDKRAVERQRTSMVEQNDDNLVISRVEDRRSVLENWDSDDSLSMDVDEKTQAYKKDKPRRRSLLDVFGQKSIEVKSERGQQAQLQQIQHPQSQQQQLLYGRPPSQVESMITHRPKFSGNLLVSPPPSAGPHSQPQLLPGRQTNLKEEKSKKKWSFFGKKKEKENQFEVKKENSGVILATAGPAAAANRNYYVGVVQRPRQPPQQTYPSQQHQQTGQQELDSRALRFKAQQQPGQQFTGGPQRFSVPAHQPTRHLNTKLAPHEPARAQLPSTLPFGSLPPAAQIPGAFPREETSQGSQVQTPVIAPKSGQGPMPSEFTIRTDTPTSSVQQLPPAIGQERVLPPENRFGAVPIQSSPMQQQQRLPAPQMQPQDQNAHLASLPQIAGPSYSQQIQKSQTPRGQHQAYAEQLAQNPLPLMKTNSNADRHVLQKRPSSAASSQKGKEVKEKKKSFLSGFLGKRGVEKDKKVGLVAALGVASAAAQHQQQHQHHGQQQISGIVPPQGQQHLGERDRGVQQWHQQQQQQMLQGGPQRQLQNGPQPHPQQLYESPSIPSPYPYVRSGGQPGPVNREPMILTPHQQMAFHQNHQPVFSDQRSYDEYVRQHQALQAQQQGIYVSLPPPPSQGYNAPRQEQVPTQFRRASQEYVRDLNARSSQEYARRDFIGGGRSSNSMAGGQPLNSAYTQGLVAHRPTSQKQEPIPVAISDSKCATRDTSNITNPPPPHALRSPIVGLEGTFPHLTANNLNANKTPDSPQPQVKGSTPFLGLNDDRKMSNLSTEDLLARSPARAQFGQQAPYQLSLPGGDDDDDYDDIPPARRPPSQAAVPDIEAGLASVTLAGTAMTGRRDNREKSPLRHQFPPNQQQQACKVPVPETAFSPIADRADGLRGGEMPPPPVPKWSSPQTPAGAVPPTQPGGPQHQAGVQLPHPGGQAHQPSQSLDFNNDAGVRRSNTVMSDVSSMTVDSPHHTLSPHQPVGLSSSSAVGYNHQPSHQHKKFILSTSPDMGDQLSQVFSHSSGVSVSPRSTPNNTPLLQQAQDVVTHQRPVMSQNRTEQVVQRIRIPSDFRSPPLPEQQPIREQASEQNKMPVLPPMPITRAPSPPIAHQAVLANATGGFVIQDDRAPVDRPTVLTQYPDHSGLIYDNSREGLIVIEDANVRRVNQGQAREEDEGPVMSATSFPGDEWRPFGWDEGGYD